MKILDRYISRSIIFTFIATVLTFCLLYVLIDSACNLDDYIDREVTLKTLVRYYLAYLPFVVVQTAPMACLIAVLFIFTNLNMHNEIIALRSSGMGFWAIVKPAIAFGLVICAAVFLINERYVPVTQQIIRQIKDDKLILEVDRQKKKQARINNMTFYGLKNRLYFIDSFDPNTHELQGITIIGHDREQNVTEKIVALKGIWTGINWKFFQCHVTEFAHNISGRTVTKVYPEKLMDIKETPKDFLKQRLNIDAMNIRQLNDYINRFANSGARRAVDNLRVDLFSKWSLPLSSIVIILVGLPFALMTGQRKAQTFTALAVACAIGFLYYVLNAVGLALGKGGLLPPFLAAFLAPLLFSIIGFAFIRLKF